MDFGSNVLFNTYYYLDMAVLISENYFYKWQIIHNLSIHVQNHSYVYSYEFMY